MGWEVSIETQSHADLTWRVALVPMQEQPAGCSLDKCKATGSTKLQTYINKVIASRGPCVTWLLHMSERQGQHWRWPLLGQLCRWHL